MPSRRGRKSAAQIPAPKAERIYGSKKNPAGSADTGKSVVLSDKTTKTLKNKFEEFRKKYPKKKNITLSDVKAVYRRGSGAYSKSHRPTITGGKPNSRAAWSFARVNKFLKKAAGEKVKAAYVQDDDLLKKDGGVLAEGGKTFNDKELLEKYNAGESIGFTATAHLKAKGLIPRADGTKRKSDKYLENGGDIHSKTLYHGSPYEFTEFSELNIGTGEGNQKYGRGFYFTESPEVAERYSLVPSDNSLYINGIKLKDETNLSDNDKMTILSIWREKWEEGYSETKEDYISEILYELQKRSDGVSKQEINEQFGADFFTKEELAEITAHIETYKRLNKYMSNSNLEIKSYVYDIKTNYNNLYFTEKETEKIDESYDGLYYDYPYQKGIKNYVIFSPQQLYIVSKKDIKMARGGINQEIECVGCGWKWNTTESDEADMYICHQCGFDNSLFYEKNILKPTLSVEEIADKHSVNVGYIENQLVKGKKHEMEHTKYKNIAEKIALHHLAETPEYYEKLEQINLEKGGVVVGKRHSEMDENGETGEKFVVESTGQVVELEGGEGVLCKESMNSDKKYIFEGKKMTGKQIASFLNHKYGGVEFAKGGKIDYACACKSRYYHGGELPSAKLDSLVGGEAVVTVKTMESKNKYQFGSKMMTPRQILSKINAEHGGKKFEEGGTIDFSDMDLQTDKQITKMVFFTEKILYS